MFAHQISVLAGRALALPEAGHVGRRTAEPESRPARLDRAVWAAYG